MWYPPVPFTIVVNCMISFFSAFYDTVPLLIYSKISLSSQFFLCTPVFYLVNFMQKNAYWDIYIVESIYEFGENYHFKHFSNPWVWDVFLFRYSSQHCFVVSVSYLIRGILRGIAASSMKKIGINIAVLSGSLLKCQTNPVRLQIGTRILNSN